MEGYSEKQHTHTHTHTQIKFVLPLTSHYLLWTAGVHYALSRQSPFLGLYWRYDCEHFCQFLHTYSHWKEDNNNSFYIFARDIIIVICKHNWLYTWSRCTVKTKDPWHLWLHEEPLTSMKSSLYRKGLYSLFGEPQMVLLLQGCPNLFLEGHCPVVFSSNPKWTHMNQLIKISRLTRNF